MSKKIIGGLVIAIEFGQVTIWAQWAIKALPQWAAVVYMAWKRQGVVQ